ncbi:MAG: CHASE3 domain-containing protein [Solirubrobacterales bacterium]|nr:CHASE3 domain-containing protein [Solirubrobacterales bacterium]
MRRSITAQFTVVLAVVSAVVLAGFAVMLVAARSLQSADRARGRSAAVLTSATALEESVLDLETGLRGYLLAGRSEFLEPYQASLRTYLGTARSLEAATSGDETAHSLSVSITRQIGAYVTGWAEPVIRLAQHDLRAARNREAGGGGKARVDAMRAQFATLLGRERTLRAGQVSQSNSLASTVLTAGIVGIVVFLVLIAYVAVRTQTRLVAPLRRLARAVGAVGRGELSVRVPEGGAAEVGELERGFNRMAQGIERGRDQLEDQRAEVEAQRDELEAAITSIEERTERIERLRRFGDRLAAEESPHAVSAATLRGIADAGGCDIGAAYLRDEANNDCFVPVAWRGLHRADLPLTVRSGEGLAGRALAERRRVSVSYGEAAMHTTGLDQRRLAAHELHLPILHGERALGVISLGRLHDHAFSDSEIILMCDLAERAGVDWAQAAATERLRRTAEELGAVLETTDEGVYGIDTIGDITLINRAALEMTGFSREEMMGNNSHTLLHHTREDGTPYPHAECPVFQSFEDGEGVRITGEVFWRRDGTSFPVEYSAYPVFHDGEITGAVVTFLDRTARRQLQRQRDTQHALTRIFAEVDSLAAARPQMLAAVCEGLGFELGLTWEPSEDETTLRPVSSYALPGFEDLIARLGGDELIMGGTLAGLAAARSEPVICTDLERDPPRESFLGDSRLQTAVGLPVRSRGGDLVAVAELFCSRQRTEDGLLDTLRVIGSQVAQFVERQQAEEDAQRMKDQIVANVSHELRTPLTAIDGWVHVLLGGEPGPLTDEQQRFLTIVKRNSDRLMRLVGDLLVAGQIEAGKLKLERDDVDVAELARETAELVASSAQAKRIALEVHADEPIVVHGDRQRLGQLLTNLVGNAIKFTPEDGAVDVRVVRRNGSCRITVHDTGIGIPKADRDRLFERFYRASSATEQGITGTGLGLAISKAIAESHQGTIEVADGDGPGTTFVVELPLTTREEIYS